MLSSDLGRFGGGYALGTADGTIKNHVSSILAKFGVRDRTRAVLKALEGAAALRPPSTVLGIRASEVHAGRFFIRERPRVDGFPPRCNSVWLGVDDVETYSDERSVPRRKTLQR
jgi:hypothetical protein